MSVVKAIWIPSNYGRQHYCCSSCGLFLALQSLCKRTTTGGNEDAIAVDLLHVFNVRLNNLFEAKCVNCNQLVGTKKNDVLGTGTNLNLKNIVLQFVSCEFDDSVHKYMPISMSSRAYGCSKCFRLVHFSEDIIEDNGGYKVVSKICAANLNYDSISSFVLNCFCGVIQGFSTNDTNVIINCEDLSDKIEKLPVNFS